MDVFWLGVFYGAFDTIGFSLVALALTASPGPDMLLTISSDMLALFPQFVRPEARSVAVQIMVLATILNLIGFFVTVLLYLRPVGPKQCSLKVKR